MRRRLLFRAVSPHNGVPVECTLALWYRHILAHHPEMAGLEAIVESAIASPLAVHHDTAHPSTSVFYRSAPASLGGLVRVAVEYPCEGRNAIGRW